MKLIFRHILLPLLLLFAAAVPASAQIDYKFDIGGGAGMSGYLGDANTSNLFGNPSWNVEAVFRYLFNPRLALKTNLTVGGLRGNSADMENVFPDAQTFKFNTTFYEVGEMFEFNFFNYGMGERYRKLKRISPYVTAGIGFLVWTVDGKSGFTVDIPFGVGVKYKLRPRVNLGAEFLMKKTLSDKVDGDNLKDPYQIKSSFMKNTDWISTLTFTISYEFGERCRACNYKE